MNWHDKYETFAEFEKSPDYKKWLDEKMKDAPFIKVTQRQKTKWEIEEEKRLKERQELLDKMQEEIENDPSAMIQVQNQETGEIEYMTQQEWAEENKQYEENE